MATAQQGTRYAYFVLVDEGRQRYMDTYPSRVVIAENADHVHFLRAVHAKSSNVMVGTHPSQLTLYANEKACRSRQTPLNKLLNGDDGEAQFKSCGTSKNNLLWIVVPSPIESKRQRTDPEVRSLDFSVKDFASKEIERGKCIKISGLNVLRSNQREKKEILMYCREDTMRLVDKLDEVNALDALHNSYYEDCRGVLIKGPRGVGKSITTWLWVCKQAASGKSVLWISVAIDSDPRLFRLTQESTRAIIFTDLRDISPYIIKATDDIVVIDGVTKEERHVQLENNVFNVQVVGKRYAISLASMSITRNDETHDQARVQRFTASPWSWEEYCEATNNSDFWSSIRPYLENQEFCNQDDEEHKYDDEDHKYDLVDQKYSYAGCSARWMFDYNVPQLIETIDMHFAQVGEVAAFFKGSMGEERSVALNYLACEQCQGKRFFTSKYIARLALDKAGNVLIREAYEIAKALNNPSMVGWIVEMDFIQQIKNSKGDVLRVNVMGSIEITTIAVNDYVRLDTNFLTKIALEQALDKWSDLQT
ncbi:hypothetical protein Ae201684P_010090 [Aphanomyces euteiches]|uniref:Uncharacterized protein n=1 Tax=Aphanomyces euteiches TaxID=100861 RepID=A0A6G0WZJ9_9STRA|nr:hypothetical protein Ae201684_009859 [Aphanomyces euteiches]KAH9095880.1 hypothetical protein Ae201684P_010090 [Aphanomyces euteiches]KAH9156589.1 hypothetical protein AeRB84_001499 [Aphanomyces euteiches]